MVYRTLFSVLLCTTVLAAPQDSGITYVKINPLLKEEPDEPINQVRESRIENIPLTIPQQDNNRQERSEPTTNTYEDFTETPEQFPETDEPVTEPEIQTEIPLKLPSPRFYSKLSYYEKSNQLYESISTNLIDTRSGKRKFRSRCRCAKISNCPKLQITVPRCPEEYFMCCF